MVASEIIGTSMGIGFASAIDPQNGHSTPALGQFFSVLLTLLTIFDAFILVLTYLEFRRMREARSEVLAGGP